MADQKPIPDPGKTPPTDNQESPAQDKASASSKSLPPTTKIADLTLEHLSALIAGEVRKGLAGGLAPVGATHVNSGPPGFVNGGGHANFDPKTASALHTAANPAAVHVNSGPPGFVNGGGHANFDPKTQTGLGAASNPAAVHVNSGPPGFVNGGGHANFDPKTQLSDMVAVTLPDGGQLTVPARGAVNLKVRGFNIQR